MYWTYGGLLMQNDSSMSAITLWLVFCWWSLQHSGGSELGQIHNTLTFTLIWGYCHFSVVYQAHTQIQRRLRLFLHERALFFVRNGHLAHFPLFLSFFLLFLLLLKPQTEEDIIFEAMEKWSRICRSTYRLRFCMWESENWGDGAVRNNLRWLDLYPCLFGLGIWLWVSYISTCSL